MKAIVCEMCGSQNLIKQDGYYVCQNCGTKYDPEEAKKLMVEIDNSTNMANWYTLARRAKTELNAEDGEKYYTLIKDNNPDDWESTYYSAFFRAMKCKIGEIESVCNSMLETCATVNSLLFKIENEDVAYIAIQEYCVANQALADFLYSARKAIYEERVGKSINEFNSDEINKFAKGFLPKLSSLLNMSYGCPQMYNEAHKGNRYEDQLKQMSLDGLKKLIEFWKSTAYSDLTSPMKAVGGSNEHNVALFVQMALDNLNIIQNIDSEFEPEKIDIPPLPSITSVQSSTPVKNSGGCYVATAVYGSYDCPQVWTLRRYRDYTLAESWFGRLFIFLYYAISPTLVKWFGETQWFKNMCKPKLDRMVKRLNEEGVSNTPYQDRQW